MKTLTPRMKLDTKAKEYILFCINGDGYDLPGDALITTEGKLRFLYETFKKEYGFNIPRMGEQKAFSEWLMGLPTCMNIAFTNHDILVLAME